MHSGSDAHVKGKGLVKESIIVFIWRKMAYIVYSDDIFGTI